jgi:predicted transcriptional regulator
MNLVSRTLEIDADTDARFREIASERGKDVATVLAEAVALLDSVVDLSDPDTEEDRSRYEEYKRTGLAVSLDDVKTWVASWGSADELPRPQSRKIRRSYFRRPLSKISSGCEPSSTPLIQTQQSAPWR